MARLKSEPVQLVSNTTANFPFQIGLSPELVEFEFLLFVFALLLLIVHHLAETPFGIGRLSLASALLMPEWLDQRSFV